MGQSCQNSQEFQKSSQKSKDQLAEEAVTHLLQYLGEDIHREGLRETPRRVVQSYQELFAGYQMSPEQVLRVTFENPQSDQMVILKEIEMYSVCEHHMIPFVGSVSIGYLPKGRIVGLSKLARLVEVYARRLQIQEKLTEDIAQALDTILQPQGCIVWIQAKHFCLCARGIHKQNACMVTTAVRGRFQDPAVRAEFFSSVALIGKGGERS